MRGKSLHEFLFFVIGICGSNIVSISATGCDHQFHHLHTTRAHPLDPLTSEEIKQAVEIVETSNPDAKYSYHYITASDPLKSELLPFFLTGTNPPTEAFDRWVFLVVSTRPPLKVYHVDVNLHTRKIIRFVQDEDVIPSVMEGWALTLDMIDIIKNHPDVQERCAKLGYANMSLVHPITPPYWQPDPRFIEKKVLQTVFYGMNHEKDNRMAHPFDFHVLFDMDTNDILAVEDLPSHTDSSTNNEGNVAPHVEAPFDYRQRGGRKYLRQDNTIRTCLPHGNSHRVVGNEVTWQKWRFRVGFEGRAGIVIHHVTYNDNGVLRPIMYRASLEELFVPYGDGRFPHFYGGFDVASFGFGYKSVQQNANEDVLGHPSFLSFYLNDANGNPKLYRNVISISEMDDGILWKRYDRRTGTKVIVRSHKLVVSVTAIFSNYEYTTSWIFYQTGEIQFEAELNGMLLTFLMADEFQRTSFGTEVFPKVNAINHQHYFTVRMDLDVEGSSNFVEEHEIVPSEADYGTPENVFGNAMKPTISLIQTVQEGSRNIDPLKGRAWVVKNSAKENPFSGKKVGYKLHPSSPSVPLLFAKDSPYRQAAGYLNYSLWVTKYKDYDYFPAGMYVNGKGGLTDWKENRGEESVVDEDLVLWYNFGTTHIPRVEDFPVMPVEKTGFWLKPTSFFSENPAMDVPPANIKHLSND